MRRIGHATIARRTISASGGFVILAPLLLAVCVVGLTLIVSRSVPQLLAPDDKGQPQISLPVLQLTEKVLSVSDWTGPYIVLVQRVDGSFTYAYIDDATIADGAYAGDVTIRYANGEQGIVRSEDGVFRFFLTKRGSPEVVRILEPLITGIKLPDGKILLIQLREGRIIDEHLIGQFAALSAQEKIQISGNRSARGTMLSLSLEPTLKTIDPSMAIIQREVLKMALAASGEPDSVLGVTSEESDSTSHSLPILSAQIGTNALLQRFEGEGVIRIITGSNNIDNTTTNIQNLNPSFVSSTENQVFQNTSAQLYSQGV
ncbi:MAG TPA: hypothetical protein VJB96_02830, partial [Patescibacteria group bacterium]|nr:hypothetical protein [Patescibacteria group bacterium]